MDWTFCASGGFSVAVGSARAASRAARQRLNGARDAVTWADHPAAPGCGRSQCFFVLAGPPEAPFYCTSRVILTRVLGGHAGDNTFHGWETLAEGVEYASAAGFADVREISR